MLPQPVIQVRDLSYQLNGQKILDHVNFDIYPGEYVGLIGPNGGGKTSLLKIILGIVPPSSGEVLLFGQPTKSFREWSKIGYVAQKVTQNGIDFPASVEEIVLSGQTGARSDWSAVEQAMQVAGVTDYRHRQIGQLSTGQRQRVFLARSLATQPKLLILDEPTTGVDQQSQASFYEFLRDLNRDRHISIIFVSHDIAVIAQEVQKILCLNQSLVTHDSPAEFIQSSDLSQIYGTGVQYVGHQH